MFKMNNKDTKEKYLFIADRKNTKTASLKCLKDFGKASSYKNQLTDFWCKSTEWFLYDEVFIFSKALQKTLL